VHIMPPCSHCCFTASFTDGYFSKLKIGFCFDTFQVDPSKGCAIIAQMSSNGCLANDEYAQRKLFTSACTPGLWFDVELVYLVPHKSIGNSPMRQLPPF